MADPPPQTATKPQAECEDTPRPRDGTQAWLGMAITVLSAAATAIVLAYAAWRWAAP